MADRETDSSGEIEIAPEEVVKMLDLDTVAIEHLELVIRQHLASVFRRLSVGDLSPQALAHGIALAAANDFAEYDRQWTAVLRTARTKLRERAQVRAEHARLDREAKKEERRASWWKPFRE